MITTTAQAIGLVATSATIFSFQQKTQKRIVTLQCIASSLWTIHFLMLGAYTGGLLNLIAATRDMLLIRSNKRSWTRGPLLVLLVCLASLGVYALSFTVFALKPAPTSMIIELLPVLGMLAHSLAMREKEAKRVRMLALISAPLWLIYNFFNRSIGGVITETFSIISIIVGYLRLDRSKKQI